MTLLKKLTAAASLAVLLGVGGAAVDATAKDYIITGIKPDKLVVVDPDAMEIEKIIQIEDAGASPATIIPTRDGKRAYALVERMEAIVEVDLITGYEINRIHLSDGPMRVKAMFGVDLSPDESTLAVFESPVKMGLNEFEVQPTRISLYDAKSGELKARTEAPRQITLLAYSTDGTKLYGLGRALHIFDAKTGEKIGEHKTQDWDRPNYYPPDILAVWSQWETAGILATPYYAARSDMDLADPTAYWTGMLMLDLTSGEVTMKDVENTDVFYFSTAASPTEPGVVFGAYNQLTKLDGHSGKSLGRVELGHSYYAVNVSSDGKKVFVGGAAGDIVVHDAGDLSMLGRIDMPSGANMSLATMRVFQRD